MIRREPENLVGSDNSFVFLHAVFFFAPEVLAKEVKFLAFLVSTKSCHFSIISLLNMGCRSALAIESSLSLQGEEFQSC